MLLCMPCKELKEVWFYCDEFAQLLNQIFRDNSIIELQHCGVIKVIINIHTHTHTYIWNGHMRRHNIYTHTHIKMNTCAETRESNYRTRMRSDPQIRAYHIHTHKHIHTERDTQTHYTHTQVSKTFLATYLGTKGLNYTLKFHLF